jgi:hypothetical protein
MFKVNTTSIFAHQSLGCSAWAAELLNLVLTSDTAYDGTVPFSSHMGGDQLPNLRQDRIITTLKGDQNSSVEKLIPLFVQRLMCTHRFH